MRARLSAAVLLCLAIGPFAGASRAAETAQAPAKVAVDLTQGYARILFTFERPTPVSASLADGVLTIKSAGQVDMPADAIAARLGEYVTAARADADGLTLHFALKYPVGLHSSTQGARTAVDLVPASFSGLPPDLPAPAPPPKKEPLDPAKLPSVKVRVGEYANFTRIVFDWPANVPYTAYPGRGRISLHFQTLAKPDFSMLESRSPPWVKTAGWRIDGDSTVVDIDTDAESRFHDFRAGTHVAVDVLAPMTDASAVAPPGVEPAAAPIKAPDAKPAAKTAAPAKPNPAPEVPQLSASIAMNVPDAGAAPSPSAELTRDGAVLHFPDARGHALAVFSRGPALWVVIDDQPLIDAATLLAPLSGQMVSASVDENAGALVLRIVLKAPLLASVAETDMALNVTLSSAAAIPPDPIALLRQGTERHSALSASLPGAVHAITLADPEAGDRIVAVPARPGKGMLTTRRYLEFTGVPSAAGLAVIPQTDDLAVEVRDATVTLSRGQGLALSAPSVTDAAPVIQVATGKQGPAFIDFAAWAGPNANVYAQERALRAAVARQPENEANRGRIDLARFLVAHRLAPEALGEIDLVQESDPKLANDPALNALRGAAEFMMGRYADARTSLSSGPLAGDPHAALWRGMAEAASGDWANARHDLAMSQSVLRAYPQEWQIRARLARAETGLAQGDLASATDALDQLPTKLDRRAGVEARLYSARLLAAQGHANEAIARLAILEQTDAMPIAIEASFARVNAQLAAKKTTSAQAIDTLEKLRYRWRGDDLELRILRRLGSLYFAGQKWREGFGVLRTAAVYFPKSDLARDAQDDMRRAFTDLFLNGKADSMPPVQALALYYDFIELTPIGRDGDEMIRRLSDRLVSVDLLGPAEQLLDYQVKNRLDGVARAVVATKLAMIYLLDHKSKDALAAINDTRESRLPDAINEERRLLEARALAGLKQFDQASDLIADDESADAKRLRADIAWDSGNWATAGAKAEETLGDRWNVDGALSDRERAEVMRAAVAYSLANDDAALSRLRERFGAKMAKSPDANPFAVVTEKDQRGGLDFRDVAKSIADVDTLQAFMADFKKREAATKTASN